MGLKRTCFVFLACAGCLSAQPGISQNGVMNAASLIPPTLDGGAIARGALFTIRGVKLGGSPSVAIRRGAVGVQARILKVERLKIQAVMPADAPLGPSELVVNDDGKASRPFRVEIADSNPGIFTQNQLGWGPGQIENLGAATSSLNTFSSPARPGERVRIATTGMGPMKQATVVIGNRRATAAVSAAADPGEERLTLRIPAGVQQSCWVPLYLLAAPGRASNVVTISIAASGKCDPGPVPLETAESLVIAAVSRTRSKAETSNAPDRLIDDAKIVVKPPRHQTVLSRNDLIPPPGTCTASTGSYQGDDLGVSLATIAVPREGGLNAGKMITLTASGEKRNIDQNQDRIGSYQARIGLSWTDLRRRTPPLFLRPGSFTLTAPGGPDVGAFTLSFSIAPPFRWTNRDQIATVVRRHGVTAHWENPPPRERMLVLARNVDVISTAVGMVLCTATPGATEITIPPELLANLPASVASRGERFDRLAVGSLAVRPVSLHTRGLDHGFVFAVSDSTRVVNYR